MSIGFGSGLISIGAGGLGNNSGGTKVQAINTRVTVSDIVLNKTIILVQQPLTNGVIVNINGLIQDVNEYAIIGTTLTLGNNIQLSIGDVITIKILY